jgi:DNA-binding response OmpR family regulator
MGQITVLVVEDDDGLRMTLTYGLIAEGFVVEAVATAAEAYDKVAERRTDVVLLDWILRDGDMGPAACRRLLEADGSVRVVMFTGLDDSRDRHAAFRAGAVAWLQKGMTLEDLADRLRRVVRDGAVGPA